jgi:predicted dehydrogenase
VGERSGRRYRTGIIGHTGAGDYGHDLDLTCGRMAELEVVALADPDSTGRARAAARSGAARTYASYSEMLAQEQLDLVVVATRYVDGHEAMLLAAIHAGAHIYCEKPLVASPAEADRVLAAADAAGVHIAVAHIGRAFAALPRLRALVAGGKIGRLRRVHGFGKCDRRGGGQDLMVLGSHILDMMCYFAGEPAWVHAHIMQQGRDAAAGDVRPGDEGVGLIAGDSIVSHFAFHGGVMGEFESFVAQDGTDTSYFTLLLEGTAGTIGYRSFGFRHLCWHHRGIPFPAADERWEPLELDGHAPEGPDDMRERYIWAHQHLIRDLLQSVAERRPPLASARAAATALEMMMAAYESHFTGGRVSLPLTNRRHPLADLTGRTVAAPAPPPAHAIRPPQSVTATL